MHCGFLRGCPLHDPGVQCLSLRFVRDFVKIIPPFPAQFVVLDVFVCVCIIGVFMEKLHFVHDACDVFRVALAAFDVCIAQSRVVSQRTPASLQQRRQFLGALFLLSFLASSAFVSSLLQPFLFQSKPVFASVLLQGSHDDVVP